MPRVFTVGAHMSRGGAYMAYHVGRIVARCLGSEPVAVRVDAERPGRSSFTYDTRMASIPIDDLLRVATTDDVLVCNPVFSPRQFGTAFPGRTLMYVQGVNTYAVLDGFFDHYVACSHFVRAHLALHYGFDTPVIVPFVHTERIGPPTPFEDRPAGSVAVVLKTLGEPMFEMLCTRLAAEHPDVQLTFTKLRGLRHDQLLEELQRHRYLLTLTVFEGYPLVPVEAMLSGCCVVGFHGGGGLDYMRPGVNAAVVGYPRLDAVVNELAGLVRDPRRSAMLAAAGGRDAGDQTLGAFEARWSAFVDDHLASTGSALATAR